MIHLYDRVVDRVLGSRRLFHDRESSVWIKDRFVPYPFQHNFHHLDDGDRRRALDGLQEASKRPASSPLPPHFESWIQSTFGSGLAEIFFLPYNRKVWGFPLDSIGTDWVDDRVALPDLELARRLANGEESAREAPPWGPNRKFYYPLHGGTGSLWSGVAALLAQELRDLLQLPLSELEDLTATQLGEPALSNLPAAMNFLYLTGIVEYDDEADSLVLASKAAERPKR